MARVWRRPCLVVRQLPGRLSLPIQAVEVTQLWMRAISFTRIRSHAGRSIGHQLYFLMIPIAYKSMADPYALLTDRLLIWVEKFPDHSGGTYHHYSPSWLLNMGNSLGSTSRGHCIYDSCPAVASNTTKSISCGHLQLLA